MGYLRPSNRTAAVLAAGILAACAAPNSARADSCAQWAAKVVSAQGSVQAHRAGEAQPRPAKFQETLCPGDTIRVSERSRADLLLPNETLLRLDENTTVKFTEPEKERISLVDLILGAAYFLSRTPRKFNVHTPFVNAGVEGTEFLARVDREKTVLTVFEGRVLATNMDGGLLLTNGQSAVAESGKAPVLRMVARPRDAVLWALYYPPILPLRPVERETPSDWRARASQLLSVGRVEEARGEIDDALKTAPGDSSAYALRSVIAVAQNEKEAALDFAKKAVEADPKSASARIALSYALQARFDLPGATNSTRDAVKTDPGNGLAWARLAELRMSSGDLEEALKAAKRAAELSPDLARTQTVLGFAYLAQVKTKASREAFDRAIALDQADPLPRLGQGLAMIRDGDLASGRESIEIAASLDPRNSLIRSYLGKAYYEEKRDRPASGQLEMAKELDPNDPTPWLYDAIRKQTLNRPVEALHDLQKSIALNDNRAVYRSRLLLDEDLAARSASLGRIFDDLGFQQLALVEGWKSVNTDPSNYSAHRFLSDSYSALPRHEIARVSELLQAQLLQPINITPIQPHLAQSDLLLLSGSGPGTLAFNEFNPMFNRNRFALQASGVGGTNRALGEEIVHSGVQGKLSYSVGQFHYQTDGFRGNNDLRENLYNAFAQWSLSYKTSVQSEFRYANIAQGDLTFNFNPGDFLSDSRSETRTRSIRFGLHHAFSPGEDLLASVFYQKAQFPSHLGIHIEDPVFPIDLSDDLRSDQSDYSAELQYLHRKDLLNLIGGAGYVRLIRDINDVFAVSSTGIVLDSSSLLIQNDIRHSNFYLYSHVRYPEKVTWTIGASGDFLRDATGNVSDRNQFNPKIGVQWTPFPDTTLRAAVFRVFRRTLPPTNQTLEPTQVAGFNQLFDDLQGTDSWRYGIAADRTFSPNVSGGAEYSRRNLDVPQGDRRFDWKERLGRAYLYWTPFARIAISGEYQYERFDRERPVTEGIEQLASHRVPVGVTYYHPCGFTARVKETYFNQKGRFQAQGTDFSVPGEPGSDRFWLTDVSAGYRLPKRSGLVAVEAKNLFDRSFKFQDTDPFNPSIQPKRTVFFKFTLAL